MSLTALRTDRDADGESISLPEFLRSVGEGANNGEQLWELIAVLPSVAFEQTIRN